MRSNRHCVALGAVFVGACATFVAVATQGLHGPLVLDSVKLYSLDGLVQEFGQAAVLHTPGFDGQWKRIVSMASFVVDVQLNGAASAEAFKTTNVCIHLLTAVLIFSLTRLLVRTTSYSGSGALVALITSVLWLLSPANMNVTLYAIQRMAMLSALFTVAGLLCYSAGRLQENHGRRWLYLAIALCFCLPMAVLSKENGILLVPLAFLIEIYFLHPHKPWFTKRQLAVAATAGAVGGLLLAIVYFPDLLNYEMRDFTLRERLLSQPRALVSYAWHLLVPLGADTHVYTDGFQVSRGLFSPLSTIVAFAACLGAIVFCIACRQPPLRFLAFGCAFFLVGHALESTVIPLELYFLHRNYLPGFGLYFAVAIALILMVPGRHVSRFALPALLVYVAFFAITDWSRAHTWATRESVAISAVTHNPRSARAWSNFAQLATSSRQFDLAKAAIDTAIQLSGTPNSRLQRIYILCVANQDMEPGDYRNLAASERFGVANELAQALANLHRLYKEGNCPNLHVSRFVESLDQLASRYDNAGYDAWTVEYYADSFLYAAGQQAAAHERLQRRADLGHIESAVYRLELLVEEGNEQQARELLKMIGKHFDAETRQSHEQTIEDLERQVGNRMPVERE